VTSDTESLAVALRRVGLFSFTLLAGAILSGTPACNAIFGLDDIEVVAGSTTTGTGGGGGASCVPAACTAPPGACLSPVCTEDDECGTVLKASGSTCSVDDGKVCDAMGACVECIAGADCESNACDDGTCVPPGCFNTVVDGLETDIDCGGTECAQCSPGKDCDAGSDCLSSVCTGQTCQAPTCVDGAKNGAETDLDCGADCAGCDPGQACLSGADCLSAICDIDVCVSATCTDGIQNGGETATDCGGPCAGCILGSPCVTAADCASGLCDASVCALLNGCAPADAVDLTIETAITVTFTAQAYFPPCFRMKAGTPLTFTGNFTGHDFYGGEIVGNTKVPDPASPFMPPTTMGTTKTFDMVTTPGDYGFYCEPHALNGMKGAVFVVP
jgi:plastocyanin